MSKLFDTQALLMDDLEENATVRDPLPVGEVIMKVAKIVPTEGKIKEGDRRGEPWYRLDVYLDIEDEEYLTRYGDGTQKKVTTIHGIMYEKNAAGKVATGPNVNIKLGKFRDATGTNGKPLSTMVGQFVRAMVEQEQDPKDPEVMRDKITAFAKV